MYVIWFCCLLFFKLICSKEYCIFEIFKPKCLENKVLYFKNALYGRIKFGKCLLNEFDSDSKKTIESLKEKYKADPGFVGCYSDVRHIIEPQCAGKQR